jgi:hypothetical protein
MASLEILPDQVRARFAHFVDSGQDFALVVSELDLLSGKKQRTLLAQYCELINVAKLQRHKFWQELQEHGHIHSSTRTNANSLSLVGIQNRHQFVAWLMRYHNRTFPITPAYLHRLSVFYTGKNKLHKGLQKKQCHSHVQLILHLAVLFFVALSFIPLSITRNSRDCGMSASQWMLQG